MYIYTYIYIYIYIYNFKNVFEIYSTLSEKRFSQIFMYFHGFI